MSDEILIQAIEAVPETEEKLPPFSERIESATLTCFLGRHMRVSNLYMQMLAGLWPLQSGNIHYFNCESTTLTTESFPAIAYLSCDSTLLSVLNGVNNVKLPALYHQLGTKEEIDDRVDALLGELDYGADHNVLPAFMTLFQKRHLLIARSIMLEPKLLFLEAPFAGLDFAETRMLEEYLFLLVQERNISVITSNSGLEFVKNYADKIIVQSNQGFHFFESWDNFYFYKQRHRMRF